MASVVSCSEGWLLAKMRQSQSICLEQCDCHGAFSSSRVAVPSTMRAAAALVSVRGASMEAVLPLVLVLVSGTGGDCLASVSQALWTLSKCSTLIETSVGCWSVILVGCMTGRLSSSLSASSHLTGQRRIGLMCSAVPKVSFLGVGDLKVLALGTGDGGSRRGSIIELACVEAMEEVEEIDMEEERPEELAELSSYVCTINCMIELGQVGTEWLQSGECVV